MQHVMYDDSMAGTSESGQERGAAGQHRLVQSVERALGMLEEIAASETPPSATEIAQRAGVNRATAWRLLLTLEHFHLIERDAQSGRYTIGHGAARLASVSGAASLARIARPVLEWLGEQLRESIYLQVTSGSRLIVVDHVRAVNPVQVDLTNVEVPFHCGSVGKLFLAFLPERERDDFLSQPHTAFTDRTITDPDLLRAELAKVKVDRFAIAYQEHLPDWAGATAAVCDRRQLPVAYLNVTVPTYRYDEDDVLAFRGPLREAAAELEQRLLYRAK